MTESLEVLEEELISRPTDEQLHKILNRSSSSVLEKEQVAFAGSRLHKGRSARKLSTGVTNLDLGGDSSMQKIRDELLQDLQARHPCTLLAQS